MKYNILCVLITIALWSKFHIGIMYFETILYDIEQKEESCRCYLLLPQNQWFKPQKTVNKKVIPYSVV